MRDAKGERKEIYSLQSIDWSNTVSTDFVKVANKSNKKKNLILHYALGGWTDQTDDESFTHNEKLSNVRRREM